MHHSFLNIVFICFLLSSCFQETKKRVEVKKVNSEEIVKADFISALDWYGIPQSMEQFTHIGSDAVVPPGIRTSLYKVFPDGKKVEILEAIWNKNDSIEIAVWYTRKQNKWIPFDHFEYDKTTDF
ncbi:hypothetical protein [Chryseobacterium sp. SL1]|uniref:hypothetical protein n=1 Tax=Chryseobacterium sp. SL1 TaxID=2995159 RepID=UPI0022762079|nr:hypothetical protein [Chryseobacterium sp. SL1]MCY1660174.1 hypothetical protein [Chryseobacterium sp. SL1]